MVPYICLTLADVGLLTFVRVLRVTAFDSTLHSAISPLPAITFSMHDLYVIFVCAVMMCCGLYTLARALIFPPTPKEDPDFYRWEVDAGGGSGSQVNIFGFRIPLGKQSPPKVLAQGVMLTSTARIVNSIVGALLFLAGFFYLLYSRGILPLQSSPHGW